MCNSDCISGATAAVFVCREELQQSAALAMMCVCAIYGHSSHGCLVLFFLCVEGEGPQREAAGGSHSPHSSSLPRAVRTAAVGVLLLERNSPGWTEECRMGRKHLRRLLLGSRMDGIFGLFPTNWLDLKHVTRFFYFCLSDRKGSSHPPSV